MRKVSLPSGATLTVAPAPFAEARALYQAVLKELRLVSLSPDQQLQNMLKDMFCAGFSSPEIAGCLWPCMQRCQYNAGNGDLKIDGETFEPVKNREDYIKVCVEVAKENVGPFVKSLYAEFKTAMSMTEKSPA